MKDRLFAALDALLYCLPDIGIDGLADPIRCRLDAFIFRDWHVQRHALLFCALVFLYVFRLIERFIAHFITSPAIVPKQAGKSNCVHNAQIPYTMFVEYSDIAFRTQCAIIRTVKNRTRTRNAQPIGRTTDRECTLKTYAARYWPETIPLAEPIR